MEQQPLHDFALSTSRTAVPDVVPAVVHADDGERVGRRSLVRRARKAVVHPVQRRQLLARCSPTTATICRRAGTRATTRPTPARGRSAGGGRTPGRKRPTTPPYTGCWLTRQQVRRDQRHLLPAEPGQRLRHHRRHELHLPGGRKIHGRRRLLHRQRLGRRPGPFTAATATTKPLGGHGLDSSTGVTTIGYNPPLLDMPGYLFDQATCSAAPI